MSQLEGAIVPGPVPGQLSRGGRPLAGVRSARCSTARVDRPAARGTGGRAAQRAKTQTREFDARPSIAALEASDDGRPAVLDAAPALHAARAGPARRRGVALLFPEARRRAPWTSNARRCGRSRADDRLDPLALLDPATDRPGVDAARKDAREAEASSSTPIPTKPASPSSKHDELAELFVERAEQRRNVGDIYKGRVNAVLPGMQSAFVDLGLAKTGFLHASDLAESLDALDDLSDADDTPATSSRRRRAPVPKIEDHAQEGPGDPGADHQGVDRHQGPARHRSRSACRAASACSCRGWITSASRAASRSAPSASASRPSSHDLQAQGRRPDRAHRGRGQGRRRLRRRHQAPARAVAEDREEGARRRARPRWCTASSR